MHTDNSNFARNSNKQPATPREKIFRAMSLASTIRMASFQRMEESDAPEMYDISQSCGILEDMLSEVAEMLEPMDVEYYQKQNGNGQT